MPRERPRSRAGGWDVQAADDVHRARGQRSLGVLRCGAADDDRRGAAGHDALDDLEATGEQVEVHEDCPGAHLADQDLGLRSVLGAAGNGVAGSAEQPLQLALTDLRAGDHNDLERQTLGCPFPVAAYRDGTERGHPTSSVRDRCTAQVQCRDRGALA
jgi:hypothetical protein